MRFDDNSRRSYTILKINVWNTEKKHWNFLIFQISSTRHVLRLKSFLQTWFTLNLLHRIPSYRKWSLWTNRTVQGRQLFITLHKAGSSRSDLFLFPSSFIFLFLLFLSFPFHSFLQSVLLLLKNGTDPSIKNNKLETPLHLSARYSRHIKQQGYS